MWLNTQERKGQINLVVTIAILIIGVILLAIVVNKIVEAGKTTSTFEIDVSNESVGSANINGTMAATALDNGNFKADSETVRCNSTATANYTIAIDRNLDATLAVNGSDCVNDTVFSDYTYFGGTGFDKIEDMEEVGYDSFIIAGLGALVVAAVFIFRTLKGA